jgi:hypothetical protein
LACASNTGVFDVVEFFADMTADMKGGSSVGRGVGGA